MTFLTQADLSPQAALFAPTTAKQLPLVLQSTPPSLFFPPSQVPPFPGKRSRTLF